MPHKVAIPDNRLVQWSDLYEQQTQTISDVVKRSTLPPVSNCLELNWLTTHFEIIFFSPMEICIILCMLNCFFSTHIA